MKALSTKARTVALTLMMLATSLFTGAVAAPSPAEAAVEDFTTICPEMTDSIYRLYTAVFLREPDQAGFDGWVDNYAAQGWHLLRIAQFFTESPEFQERYGSLSDTEFVDLIYQNVLGRLPDADGRAFWIDRLNTDLTRGGLLLFFSESEEYVLATGTYDPLAGYLRSYTPTSVWGCGVADHTVGGSVAPRRYWDIYVDNQSGGDVQVKANFVDANGIVVRESNVVLVAADDYSYQWNIDVTEVDPALANSVYGIQFDAIGDEDGVYVIAVGTDRPMPSDRPSWVSNDGSSGASLTFAD